MTFSHYDDKTLARLKNEAQASDKKLADRITALEKRLDAAEFFERWVRETLYPSVVTAFALIPSTIPEEPPP